MTINKELFLDIEEAFVKLQEDPYDTKSINAISEALKKITKKNIQIVLFKGDKELNIMSVYPNEEAMSAIVDAIVNNDSDSNLVRLWNDVDDWTIEIDTRILTSLFDFDNKELTALLLHEVGHVVYSNSIPMKISKVVRTKFVTMSAKTKGILSNDLFKTFLFLPIINICDFKKDNMREEIAADKYSINAGYKEALSSAMEKIMAKAKRGDLSDETNEIIDFSQETIEDISERNERLVNRNLMRLKDNMDSPYTKRAIDRISSNVSVMDEITEAARLRYIRKQFDIASNAHDNKMLIENTETETTMMMEGIFNRVKKMKRIDPADLDYIILQANDINNNDDKMMLVSYIYSKIDTIDYYISILDSQDSKYIIPHSKESLIQMRERLMKYKDTVINKKLPEIVYGINIQYPGGYEG